MPANSNVLADDFLYFHSDFNSNGNARFLSLYLSLYFFLSSQACQLTIKQINSSLDGRSVRNSFALTVRL